MNWQESDRKNLVYSGYIGMSTSPTGLGRKYHIGVWMRLFDWCGVLPGRILEIGPGRGEVGDWCKSNGIRYTCVEATESLHEDLVRRGYDSHLGFVPPLPDTIVGKFDLVVMRNVLEHMPSHREALELLIEAKNVLNRDGSILISVPRYNGYRFFDCVFDHSYICTLNRMRGLLLAAGYKDMRLELSSFYFRGILARLWCVVGRLIPFELPKDLFPNNKWMIRWQKAGSFFRMRIDVVGKKN